MAYGGGDDAFEKTLKNLEKKRETWGLRKNWSCPNHNIVEIDSNTESRKAEETCCYLNFIKNQLISGVKEYNDIEIRE